MGVAPSSSSSSALPLKKYDVFLSFRGEDTRRTFTSHLHTALCVAGIETYIDYEIPKGDGISDALIQAIEHSSIAVVVFSENYASSKWCLKELAKIVECRQLQEQHIIPVFYEVDPSHVRNQKGTYQEAFAKHERDFKHDPNTVNKWKHALSETANLAGWDSRSRNYRDEAQFIQNIVNDILQKLNCGSSSALKDIIGIDKNSDCIELLLEKFSIIGIWGMGGIGKTTIAKVVFAKFKSQFDSCFLENLREESEKNGLNYVRDKLFQKLLKDSSPERLSRKKVFIVLDDVSSTNQLDYLTSEAPPLGPDSKVIITSRDRHVLEYGRVDKIHEARALSYDNSLKLFNLKAFPKDGDKSEYKELVGRAMAYAQGNPLALSVLGSFLHSKTIKEWESQLKKLEKMTHKDIQAVLRLSYDGLDDEVKDVFLDIACFLKGEYEERVIATLESCGFHVHIDLRILVDKALISIDNYKVQMHDLIQSMGWEIVRQECINDPGERSRLWNSNEIYDVLKNNQGTKAIEGIILNLSQIRDIHLSAHVFKDMTNLRFLKFYSGERACTMSFPSGLESFSNSLRYFQWDNFPSESLPSSFCAEKLVELHMPGSHLKKLWDGVQDLVNLRKINLSRSKQLIELPDFSKAQNLEEVNLQRCETLCHIHPSILSLQRLATLELKNCKSLMNLQSESHLKSLSWLTIEFCYSLKEFSLSSARMTQLYLSRTGIEILGSSIGRMEKLGSLSINCSTLKILPVNEICCLRSLQYLNLYDCGEIIDKSTLHTLFDALLSLETIAVNGSCKLTELPNNIKHLSKLNSLYLEDCKRLQSLPELPPSIQKLEARNCTSLKTLVLTSHLEFSLLADEIMSGLTSHSSIVYLRNLKELTLEGCEQWYELPKIIGSLSSLESLTLSGSNLESLPASIKHLSKLKCISLSNCTRLHSLPELPPLLEQIYLGNCKRLHSLPELPPLLGHIYLSNCKRLHSLPELPPFTESVFVEDCISLEIVPRSIMKLQSLSLRNSLKLEKQFFSHITECAYFSMNRLVYTEQKGDVSYPGTKVPEWFRDNQATKASNFVTTIELPSTMNNLVGFIFCCVVSHYDHNFSHLQCQIYFEDTKHDYFRQFIVRTKVDSHHVFLWHVPLSSNFRKIMDDQDCHYKPKVSFKFSAVTVKLVGEMNFVEEITKHDDLIEACGVCPIYASEYHNFLQQMELKSKLGTCYDVDEQSLRGILEYSSFSLKPAKCGSFERGIIPEWFAHESSSTFRSGVHVGVELTPNFDSLLGFIFCFVIPRFSSKERDRSRSSCECLVDGDCVEGQSGWHYSMTELNSSNNVFLWYDPLYCERIIREVKKEFQWRKGDDEETRNHNLELKFEFQFGACLIDEWGIEEFSDCLIKECGVRPIYVSEYRNFLQRKELKMELSRGKKRHRNIDDDQQQLPSTKKRKDVDELLFALSQLNLSQ